MGRRISPILLWLLCAGLWGVVAVERSSAGNVEVVTTLTKPADTSDAEPTTVSKPDSLRVETAPLSESCINVNQAAVGELDRLPGVGPVIAQRIIAYRTEHGPFKKLTDMQKVRGIGPATVKKIGTQACF
jgi:competence protein ComEA